MIIVKETYSGNCEVKEQTSQGEDKPTATKARTGSDVGAVGATVKRNTTSLVANKIYASSSGQRQYSNSTSSSGKNQTHTTHRQRIIATNRENKNGEGR